MHALLFDLGGTFLRAGVATPGGTLANTAKTRIRSIADGLPEDAIWPRVATHILDYEIEQRSSVPRSAPVVISFPGPAVNGRRVLQAPTVAGASTSAFDLAGAMAETTQARRFMVVTVSSGIGSKIFDRCHSLGVLESACLLR